MWAAEFGFEAAAAAAIDTRSTDADDE